MGWLVGVLIWVMCSCITFGGVLAYLENRYWVLETYRQNVIVASIIAIFGPLGLVVSFFLTGMFERGFRYKSKRF